MSEVIKDDLMRNDLIIRDHTYDKKVMAEEVLHKNPGAKILPTQPVPDELPPISEMIPILHKTCGDVAFYYTHVPMPGEMMMATRARTRSGDTIEPSQPMKCYSCDECIENAYHLQVNKSDYEAAHA